MSRRKHFEQIIERAKQSDWSNREAIITECERQILSIEKEAAEFNAKWRRLKEMKRNRKAA